MAAEPYRCRAVDAGRMLALTGQLHPLYRACFAEPPWHETAEQLDAFPQRLARIAARPGASGHVVDQGGRLVGAVVGWPMPVRMPTESPEDRAVAAAVPEGLAAKLVAPAFLIAELMVAPEHRRHGIGRTLLSAITAEHPRSWLSTHPQAPAVGLYQAEGWRPLFSYALGDFPLVVFLKED